MSATPSLPGRATPSGTAAHARAERVAALVLMFSATLWGLAWWPMQQLAAAGVQGPALALMSYGGVGLLALPLLWRQRALWRGAPAQVLMIVVFGGWAAASFIFAMTQGDVVREMLLFYLSPVWSVLGGRVFLKEHLGTRRMAAVALAMAGAFLVIRGGGEAGGGSITLADLLALSSSITFAANNLVTRAASGIPVASKAILMMLGCGLISGLIMLSLGLALPALAGPAALGVVGFAAVWIVGGSTTTAYGMSHMEAGRAAIILLAELVAAVVSASLIKGRIPSAMEVAGATLILAAAALDVWES